MRHHQQERLTNGVLLLAGVSIVNAMLIIGLYVIALA